MPTTKLSARDADGKYNHGLGRVCKCGRTKGAHLAVRPYPMDDDSCERFRLAVTQEPRRG